MKNFARLVWILAVIVNLATLIFNLLNGSLVLAIVSFVAMCAIIIFGARIGIWSKKPWVT
jgi:hypothetical protein